ncbi:MAG: hypothetical protein WC358_01715 [Ignavibacteria bacterium]|jgi:predicted RNase H-like HicB family nuclease
MLKTKEIKLKLLLGILKEGEYFVAYCPAFDLSGYGYSEKEAKSSFEKNVEIFLEETIEKGTLEKVLLNLGWTLRKKPSVLFEPPNIETKTIQRFAKSNKVSFTNETIPISLVV